MTCGHAFRTPRDLFSNHFASCFRRYLIDAFQRTVEATLVLTTLEVLFTPEFQGYRLPNIFCVWCISGILGLPTDSNTECPSTYIIDRPIIPSFLESQPLVLTVISPHEIYRYERTDIGCLFSRTLSVPRSSILSSFRSSL